MSGIQGHQGDQENTSVGGLSRRDVLQHLGAGIVAIGVGNSFLFAPQGSAMKPTSQDATMSELRFELLYEAHFDLAPAQAIDTPNGRRMIFAATGLELTSPKFEVLELLPGGGDWARIRNDGVIELDVRAVMRLDDESLVYLTYGGVIAIPEEPFGRLIAGEEVDPSEYYFRVTPRFETASEQYGWLNNIVAVANGKIGPSLQWVEYVAFQIL